MMTLGDVVSYFGGLFRGPDNNDIKKAREDLAEAIKLAEGAGQLEAEAKRLKEAAFKKQSDANKREAKARELQEHAQKYLELATASRPVTPRGIRSEIWPTEEEFQDAKDRIKYDSEKIHLAVCGCSGAGKSSLVNAFRGLDNSPDAAPVETTKVITRYPDPRKESPYNPLVWFDCPGAGTHEVLSPQYFNQQGLFIFDVIVLVYDTHFSEIDVSIIQNCERFNIPLFIVRSKADIPIRGLMQNLGYDENDDDAKDEYDKFQAEAQKLLINITRTNIEKKLKKAGLAMHDVFIVSSSVVYSLVTGEKMEAPVIDETRLLESVLKTAYERAGRNVRQEKGLTSRQPSTLTCGSMVLVNR